MSRFGEVRHAHTSLNGTMMNCSGGRLPWGAWVICEETVNGPDVGPDFTGTSNIPLTKPHGYVFEVPTSGSGQVWAYHCRSQTLQLIYQSAGPSVLDLPDTHHDESARHARAV